VVKKAEQGQPVDERLYNA